EGLVRDRGAPPRRRAAGDGGTDLRPAALPPGAWRRDRETASLVGPARLRLHAPRLLPLCDDPRLPDSGCPCRRACDRRDLLLRRVRGEGPRRPRPLASGVGAPDGGSDARLDARRPLADVEPLVFHDREIRLLMRRGWRPVIVGALVAAGTFALAEGHVFAPSAAPTPAAS